MKRASTWWAEVKCTQCYQMGFDSMMELGLDDEGMDRLVVRCVICKTEIFSTKLPDEVLVRILKNARVFSYLR